MKETAVHLTVDRRERGKIIKDLEALPSLTLEYGDLDVGDYIAGPEVAVERKSATDFILSIVDESLYEKAAKLKSRYARAAYVVEGDLFTRRFHQKAFDVHRALAYLAVHFGMPVITSPNSEQTAMILYLMAVEATRDEPIRLRPPGPEPVVEAAPFFLEGLPGIDSERAEKLLDTFGSVSAVLAADRDALRAAADLAERDLDAIARILNARWPA